jgi:predicted nucleic acid-binding protein
VETLMRYLLDTNTLIYVLNARPDHQAVIGRFDRETPENLAASSITLAELQYCVAKEPAAPEEHPGAAPRCSRP